MNMVYHSWMMKTQYHFGSVTIVCLTQQQRRFVFESMLNVSSYKQCATDFKKKTIAPNSKNGIATIMGKWNQFSVQLRINSVACQGGPNGVHRKTLVPSPRSLVKLLEVIVILPIPSFIHF